MEKQSFQFLRFLACLGIAAGVAATGAPGTQAAPQKKAPQKKPPAVEAARVGDNTPLTEEQKIVHALNRLGFGPRPGDVERVRAMGLNRYIEQQLHPERIDDRAVEAKLAGFDMLDATYGELQDIYVDGLRGVIQVQQLQKMIQENAKLKGIELDLSPLPPGPDGALRRIEMLQKNATPEQRVELRNVLRSFQNNGRQKIRIGLQQMTAAKIVRAVESERQLNEVLVDFWSNHFNIDVRKNVAGAYKIADEREVIRKHALGKFRDLIGASAKSPAMLVYLDNDKSSAPPPVSPRAAARRRPGQAPPPPPARGRGGLNENYARELMELHTLGVNGGYTQKDVQEVARCLTGWGVAGRNTPDAGEFRFDPRRHDNGEKVVLGVRIPAGGGITDGERVLDMLAQHPSTMKFISTKLCRRLVADEPPASLVDKCVATWKRTDGDIREVVRTIVTSPEFFSRAAYRQKIKSPFEYAVSSVRALGGTFDENALRALTRGGPGARPYAANGQRTLIGAISTLGQPLYQFQAPTGWPEESTKWVSSGALIARLNFALSLANGGINEVDLSGARAHLTGGATEGPELVTRIAESLLNGDVSPSTRATLLKQAQESPGNQEFADMDTTRRLVALTLGSPEFQRR
jgi:Uncharacterized protein conserved in bacteria